MASSKGRSRQRINPGEGKTLAVRFEDVVGGASSGDSASNDEPYALYVSKKVKGERRLNNDSYRCTIIGTRPPGRKATITLTWQILRNVATRELDAEQVEMLHVGQRVPIEDTAE